MEGGENRKIIKESMVTWWHDDDVDEKGSVYKR